MASALQMVCAAFIQQRFQVPTLREVLEGKSKLLAMGLATQLPLIPSPRVLAPLILPETGNIMVEKMMKISEIMIISIILASVPLISTTSSTLEGVLLLRLISVIDRTLISQK